VTDDSDPLQRAIDRAQETVHHGIVFVPEGRYRLTRTIHVWAGIRLIGYGEKRPVFVLAPNTPGFQAGADKDMLWFTDERTPFAGQGPANTNGSVQPIGDASEFTFFSAVSNIDFEIGEGNPAARRDPIQRGAARFCCAREFPAGKRRGRRSSMWGIRRSISTWRVGNTGS